jgi:hypothetical protein
MLLQKTKVPFPSPECECITSKQQIKYIPYDKFKELGKIPRYPENQSLCITLDKIDLENSLLVFVSHRWLRENHPDTSTGGKYELIVEGVDKLLKTQTSGFDKCYLWIDYGCIDQDGDDPAREMKQWMNKIVEFCDCLLHRSVRRIQHLGITQWDKILMKFIKAPVGLEIMILI